VEEGESRFIVVVLTESLSAWWYSYSMQLCMPAYITVYLHERFLFTSANPSYQRRIWQKLSVALQYKVLSQDSISNLIAPRPSSGSPSTIEPRQNYHTTTVEHGTFLPLTTL
jgi:hypothetical protein